MSDPTQDTRERFAHLARRADADLDLEEGAILIAAEEYPELEPAAVRLELDRLGDAAGAELAGVAPAERVERLNRFLFEQQRFAGAREYYDPRNSYLNDVLERRVGIPITLALVYIGVGRRAGIDARGVSFPGHFLVRCAGRHERIVDAFYGRTLERTECEARLANALGPGVALRPELHLRDATPREILVRMLANLQRIFASHGDGDRLLACCDRILLLTPEDPAALRERALVYEQLGWLAAAVADLQAALAALPEGPARTKLRARHDALRRRMGPLH
jgi:regulator of sirC expression with transglutaminase-like and TPR domain